MVEVTLDPIWGYRTLRNENPRMGVRGVLGEGDEWPTQPHHEDFLYPGFRIWISEFRIPYGVWEFRNTAP
jgi:hypothetical protein